MISSVILEAYSNRKSQSLSRWFHHRKRRQRSMYQDVSSVQNWNVVLLSQAHCIRRWRVNRTVADLTGCNSSIPQTSYILNANPHPFHHHHKIFPWVIKKPPTAIDVFTTSEISLPPTKFPLILPPSTTLSSSTHLLRMEVNCTSENIRLTEYTCKCID